MKSGETEKEKVKCPFCGYKMPIKCGKNAVCKGLYVKCKARSCGKEFEIRINGEIK